MIVLGEFFDSGVLTEEWVVREGRPFVISNMSDFFMCLRYSTRSSEEDEDDEDHERVGEKEEKE